MSKFEKMHKTTRTSYTDDIPFTSRKELLYGYCRRQELMNRLVQVLCFGRARVIPDVEISRIWKVYTGLFYSFSYITDNSQDIVAFYL